MLYDYPMMTNMRPLALLAAAILCGLAGCSKKTCAKDTDCKIPEICVAAVCTNIYGTDARTDVVGDQVTEVEARDGDAVSETEGADVAEGTEGGDAAGECLLQPSLQRTILGPSANSGPGERPQVATISEGSFFLLGRKVITDPTDGKLTVVKVTTSGTVGAPAVDIMGSANMPPHHHLFPASTGMGVLLEDPNNLTPTGGIIYISLSRLGVPSSPVGLEFTGSASGEPYGVDNGTNNFVAWTETGAGGTTIKGAVYKYNGDTVSASAGAMAGDGTSQVDHPVVAWGSSGYLLAYVHHDYDGLPGSPDAIGLASLDDPPAPVGDPEMVPVDETANSIVGRPAIAWAGDRWAVLWQEADGGATTDAVLHLTTKAPGEDAVDHDITGQWSSKITAFDETQPGELGLAWNGSSLGIVIKHDGGVAGKKIYFGEFTLAGTIRGSVFVMNPEASDSSNPSVAFMESATQRYYLIAFLQFSGELHSINAITLGCDR